MKQENVTDGNRRPWGTETHVWLESDAREGEPGEEGAGGAEEEACNRRSPTEGICSWGQPMAPPHHLHTFLQLDVVKSQ